MTLTAKDVAEIMRLLEQSSFESLSLEIDGVKLNLQRASSVAPLQAPPAASAARTEPRPPPVTSGPPKPKPPSEPGLYEITCPLLGIFYRAPKPGELPFIDVGSRVSEDTVVGIVEVMKLMNSVHAGVTGTVVEILAENGALVEFGEILMRVRPGS